MMRRTPAPQEGAREYRVNDPLVGKVVVTPPPPRCRKGVDSPHLPRCPFRALGGSIQSSPEGELSVLTYAGLL